MESGLSVGWGPSQQGSAKETRLRACAFQWQSSREAWEQGTPSWLLGSMAWFSFRVREVLGSMPQAAPCRCPRGALLGLPMCHLSSDGKCAKKQSLRAGSDTVPRKTESRRKTRKTCISQESNPGRIHGSSAVYHYRALSAQPATASAEPGSEARCARARARARLQPRRAVPAVEPTLRRAQVRSFGAKCGAQPRRAGLSRQFPGTHALSAKLCRQLRRLA